MTKFELYVNNDDRLTLELFLKEDSEFSMNRVHGAGCYGIISEIRNQKILKVKQSANNEDLTIYYENCILNVNEANITLLKRGAVQIGNDVVKYLQNKKRRELEEQKSKTNNNEKKPLKVKRKNKYGCLPVVVSGLALLSLISVLILKQPSKDNSFNPSNPSSYSQSFENDFNDLIEEKYEEVLNLNNENNFNDSIEEKYEEVLNLNNEKSYNIFIQFEDRSQTEKAKITKAYYQETIEKYAKMYGLDSRIILAIATQERGIHSDKMDAGGATGLMQIQNEVWVGENLTAYNYEKNEYETVYVTKEDLSDVFKNIKYGCMIFQNCLRYMNNNTLAAIQCYNMGYGNMMKIFNSYSLESGKTKEQILNDFYDCGWLNHRNIISAGDQKYLEHVLSWIGAEINVNRLDDNGNTIEINIINENESKNMSIN